MLAEIAAQESAPTRAQILQAERLMRELPQLAIEPAHTFGPGFYARTIEVPAGATLTGKVHSTEHIFILSRGEMLLATEDGRRHVKAPFQCVSRPGLKRIGHALTDCEVTNVHITRTTDLQTLERELIVAEAIDADAPLQTLEG